MPAWVSPMDSTMEVWQQGVQGESKGCSPSQPLPLVALHLQLWQLLHLLYGPTFYDPISFTGPPWLQLQSGDLRPFSSVHFSRSVVSDSLRPHESQHTRPPCPSPTPGIYSNSCPSSRWCHPAILSSAIPFSFLPQSLPASGSFPMSQLFAWGGQSTGVSAWASVLPMNTQDWSPVGWPGWMSLQSKGLSGVFSNTIVQKHL